VHGRCHVKTCSAKSCGSAGIGTNSTWLVSTRLDTFDMSSESSESRRTYRAWRVCRAVLFQHNGRQRSSSACVYKFNFVCFVRTRSLQKTEKKTARSVGQRLSEKRETFGCYNSNVRYSESMSDLVKLHAHRHRAVWGTFQPGWNTNFKKVYQVQVRMGANVWFCAIIFYLLGNFVTHRIQGVSKIMPTLSTKYTEQSLVLSTTLQFNS